MPGTDWLTPTSAWRLTLCAASAGYSAGPFVPPPARLANAGSVAHASVRAWIEDGNWRRAGGPTLSEHFDAVSKANGLRMEVLADGRVTRARLGLREEELRAVLLSAGHAPAIACETAIADPARLIWGVPDVVARGERTILLDLKTGRDAFRPLAEQLRRQLLIYAHLVRQRYGNFPDTVAVFSLIRGLLELHVDPSEVEELLDQVDDARQGPPEASPTPGSCRYCPRRLNCEPHWQEVSSWSQCDALEGDLLRAETAESGAVSLQLSTEVGTVWLTRVRPGMVHGAARPGAHIRAIRISSPDRDSTSWRTSPESVIRARA